MFSGSEVDQMIKAVLILVLLATSSSANAAVRNYFTPRQDGVRLSSCLADNLTCGKSVADAFCKGEGFAESILFAREPVSEAMLLGEKALCGGAQCEAFTRIKCFSAGAPEASLK
jgi:hypothetical protein